LVEICFSAAVNPLTGIAADAWPIAKLDPSSIPSATAMILSLVTTILQSEPDTFPASLTLIHPRWLKAEGVVA
jgi:hypothetical protein